MINSQSTVLPPDCVRLALLNIMPTADLILAGINHGGNLGADVYYSGTVAAAREATLHGRRAIAFSYLRHHDRSLDWNRAELWVSKVIFELSGLPWEPGSFYNVNFPNLSAGASDPKLVYCDIDINPLPLVFHSKEEGLLYTGDYYSRARTANLDVDNCFRGAITISVIRLGAPA
jgi:5'-nucleotidase